MKQFFAKIKDKLKIKSKKDLTLMESLNKYAKKIPLVKKAAKNLNLKPGTVLASIIGFVFALIFIKYGL